ncbi:hypothetical protein Y597_4468 [Burkholderia pseudomallei MSHR1000]|nr:hypothetical protein Y597_4468 [Burkholderia pseudomallei MSHR1000]
MREPFACERQAIERQCRRALRLHCAGQCVRYVERKPVDAKTRRFGRNRGKRFGTRYVLSDGSGVHRRVALLRVTLLLRLAVLFRIRACSGGLVGRRRGLLGLHGGRHQCGERHDRPLFGYFH